VLDCKGGLTVEHPTFNRPGTIVVRLDVCFRSAPPEFRNFIERNLTSIIAAADSGYTYEGGEGGGTIFYAPLGDPPHEWRKFVDAAMLRLKEMGMNAGTVIGMWRGDSPRWEVLAPVGRNEGDVLGDEMFDPKSPRIARR
jgi:hypothetical protein